jgi:hypothetical protein
VALRVTTGQEAGLGEMIPSVADGGISARANAADFGATNAAYVGQAGQALQQGADTLDKFARQDALITAQQKALDGELYWHQKLRDMQNEAPAGAPGFAKQVGQAFDDWSKQQLDTAPNGIARQALQERFLSMRVGLGDQAADFEDKALLSHRETQLKDVVDKSSSVVFTQPAKYGDTLRQTTELIANSDLPATAKEKLTQDYTHALADAFWRGQADRNPGAVAGMMASGAATGLDFQSRVKLYQHATSLERQQQANAREELRWQHTQRREAQQDARQAREDAQKANEDKLTGMFLDPGISREDKTAALRAVVGKRGVSGGTARALAGFLKEDATADDFHAVSGLIDMQQSGDPNFRQALGLAVDHGLVRGGTAKTLYEDQVRREQAGGVMAREDVKAAEKMLADRIDPPSLVKLPDPEAVDRKWKAIRTFRDALNADPKADPFKVADQALGVATPKVGTVDNPVAGGSPSPRFLVGPPEKPDVAASVEKLRAAVAKGEAGDQDATELEKYLDGYFAVHPDQRPQ